MRKSRFSILIATAIVGCCVLAGVARAQEGMGPPPPGIMGGPPPVPPPLMMALRTANPTDDQKKQIHDILESSRQNTAAQMEQMRSIRDSDCGQAAFSGPRERF